MKVLVLNVGSMLGSILVAQVAAAEPPFIPPAHADISANGRSDASSEASAYARRRERLRQAGWLRQETTRRLRAEAGSAGEENLRAIDDLINLYVLLRLDDTLTDSGRDRLVGKVRSRLLRIQERFLEKPDPAAAPVNAPTAPQPAAGPESRPGQPGSQQLADFMARRTAVAAGEIWHHVLAQQGLGGPVGAVAAGAAQPFPPDYGPQLADLIQTVVAPSTWERNGGPGSIYYYRPRQVLVIRQTGQVHEDIGDVVEQLRQAGN